MATFDHDGWTLAFGDDGSGPAVLLVHGLMMDRTMFSHQVEALRDRYRVITPDLRGHGESAHRAQDYTQWDLMEDHVALLDHLDLEHAVWGGVSQGGFQALRAALRHPDRAAGLILIDTQAGTEDPERTLMYEAMAEVAAREGLSEDLAHAAVPIMFGASAGEDVTRHWVGRWMAQRTDDAREVMRAVTAREDLTDRLQEIDRPAVVIHGEEDVAIDMELAQRLADGLPNLIDFVTVPRAGHSSPVENPHVVTDAIDRFLGKGSENKVVPP